jgi:hypothetical protein
LPLPHPHANLHLIFTLHPSPHAERGNLIVSRTPAAHLTFLFCSDWVTNAAVRYITTTFTSLKQRRIQLYSHYVCSLPYYREYRKWHGAPPLPRPILAQLVQQLKQADRELQDGINADWRNCVLKYPEVLDYYYEQVEVALPRGAVEPPFGGHGAPAANGAASAFSGPPGGGMNKGRKSGGRASAPPGAFVEETLMRTRSHREKRSSRDSGSYVVSGRNKAPVAPTPPIAPAYPYQFGL